MMVIVIIQKQGKEMIKELNHTCQFLWVSFLGLVLGLLLPNFQRAKGRLSIN